VCVWVVIHSFFCSQTNTAGVCEDTAGVCEGVMRVFSTSTPHVSLPQSCGSCTALGSNDVENAEIAGIADHFKDFTAEYIKWSYEKDEGRKAEIKKKLDEEITPKYLTNFEKLITADGWLYGSKVTYVDLLFFNFSPHITEGMLPKYPGLKALTEKVEALPNIAKWLKDRPDTQW